MTSLTNAPTASKYTLTFAYDYMGRRIQKLVSTNTELHVHQLLHQPLRL